MSNAATLLTNLTGQSNWQIQQASYKADTSKIPVYFHIFQGGSSASDTGILGTGITLPSPISIPQDFNAAVDQVQDSISRRVPTYRFPYVDGQGTDDLGREASSYEFDAIIHGPNYYNAYINLLNELNKPVTGTLVHPVLGNITVKFMRAKVTYRSRERQAATLHLEFEESNVAVSFTTTKPTLKSTLANAAAFISAISNTITNIQGYAALASTTLLAINHSITSLTSAFSNFLVSLNSSFNSGTSADIPALLPTGAGNSVFPSATASTGIFAGSSPAQVQQSTTGPVSAAQAKSLLDDLVTQAQTVITQIESANNGQGALIFYAETNTIRQAILAAKSALLLCLQTSNATTTNYTTPQLMTIREVCFANGIDVNNSQDVLTLNPSLLSANYIPQGTVLQIPSA